MKRLKSYNESIRDKMTPRSEQEVEDAIGDCAPNAKLEAAVSNGVLFVVKKAIEEGADIKKIDDNFFNKACQQGYTDVIKFLIDNGFYFHYHQEFALRSSVWSNRIDVVRLLLEEGADVHADDENALGAALENYMIQDTSIDMIKLLLDYGATPKKRDYNFARSWKTDKEKGYKTDEVLNMFELYKKKVNEGVRDMMTPKPEEEIRKTLEAKPPKDKIAFGISKDIPWLVMQGLEEGKDVDVTENDNYLLNWACKKGDIPLVKLLLERGADIHSVGDTPLRNACYNGNTELVKFLLDKGADANADRGYLLSVTAKKGYYYVTELLLKAGATKKIDIAIRMARDSEFNEIVELLKKYLPVNESIKDLMTPRPEDELKNTMKNMDSKRKRTELKLAVAKQDSDMIEYLLKNKVNPNVDKGWPLIYSSSHGRKEIVDVLLKYGANPNVDFGAPLRYAIINKHYNVLKSLVDAGGKNPFTEELLRTFGKRISKIVLNESVRDKMTGKPLEDIKKDLSKLPQHKLLGRVSEMEMKLTDIYTEEEILELDPDVLLSYSFYTDYIKGIKYVLDNYRLYGQDVAHTISIQIPDIKNDDDMEYLLKDKQIIRFLTSDQKYVLEKYRLGMHQNEIRDYEKRLIEQLDRTDYYQSKSNPSVMIGKNKKGDKNLFNYNKNSKLLTYHLDNMSSWLTGIDDEDNYESHRGDKMYNNETGFGARYFDLIMRGVIGKYYGIKIDKANGSRNDDYSFVKD